MCCILTDDRGYAKSEFADVFSHFGFSLILINSESLPKSNPFVADSMLKGTCEYAEAEEEDADERGSENMKIHQSAP